MRASVAGDADITSMIVAKITKLSLLQDRTKWSIPSKSKNVAAEDMFLGSFSQNATGKRLHAEHRPPAPYPSATPVLERPYASVTGRRRIPIFVSANKIPFLRFKKPQSPFLSRLINDKIKQRQKLRDRLERTGDLLEVAKAEDAWDRSIAHEHGISHDLESLWVDEIKITEKSTTATLINEKMKNSVLAAKMIEIVDREKELVMEEREARRRSNMQDRWVKGAARLARKAKEEMHNVEGSIASLR